MDLSFDRYSPLAVRVQVARELVLPERRREAVGELTSRGVVSSSRGVVVRCERDMSKIWARCGRDVLWAICDMSAPRCRAAARGAAPRVARTTRPVGPPTTRAEGTRPRRQRRYLGDISAYAERDVDRVLVVQVARRRRRLGRSSLSAAVLSPPEEERVHLLAYAVCLGRW